MESSLPRLGPLKAQTPAGPLLLGASGSAFAESHHRKPAPRLVPVGTYDTGLGTNGAEIISVRDSDGIAALTNVKVESCGEDTGAVDVLNLSVPARPALLRRVCVDPASTAAGAPNSAAVHPYGDYFLVALGKAGARGAVAAYRLSDGAFLASAPVGILPDSIAISPNGRWAVVANEAEGVDKGDDGGAGSLSVLDLARLHPGRPSRLQVMEVPLPSQAGVAGFSDAGLGRQG